MENNKVKNELSREQILDLADASGRKLGFLLATSSLSDDVKRGLVSILEYATPAQLDVLMNMLEEGYLKSKLNESNDFLKSELAKLKSEAEKADNKLEKETIDRLKDLEKKVK